ncbi:hypothetical protein [Natrinema pallidum]|nr:hypothetical protein [Natrinema pallidum]
MKAVITGESKRIGVKVQDNNGVDHGIEMICDGEIKYHEQDGYSDYPAERTQAENEHVRQARRFAKWHVYKERGYETLPRHENPDCLVAAMIAVSALSSDTVEGHFGDLRTQLESHYDDSSLDLPFDDAHPDDVFIYRKDLYLSPDPLTEDSSLAEQYNDLAAEIRADLSAVFDESDNLEHQLTSLFNHEDRLETELPSFDLEAVSEMHSLHTDGRTEQTTTAESPLDREPDAQIELPPLNLEQFELFKLLLVTNLSAQVRDRFLMMGEEPPEAFQHQGFGTYRGTIKQQINDMYERYYLFSESPSTWTPTRS